MKRENKDNVVSMDDQYPFKNSPQSLTLGNEIKRISEEREELLAETINKLAKLSGVTERQIYNYRTGKTDIPSGLIPVFCKQFASNALMMSIWHQCKDGEEFDEYDIVKLANRSARSTLAAHSIFLEAFEDGKIDGFEINELKEKTAKSIAHFNRLEQVAMDAHRRGKAA